MKKYFVIVLAGAALAACCVTAALTQPAPQPAAPAPANANQAQGFTPGFDDIMTMLVQPRHIRLYYAGGAKNWELAAAESRDLRQSFDRLAQSIPNYEGMDVKQGMGAFITPKLDAIDAAIAAADAPRFDGAYKDLTGGCNECHHYMEHPFLVIKVPDTAQDTAHPDQVFTPEPN